MASRTPPLQSRSAYHSHWGEYASAADLPNASGAPLAASQFVLEAGDVAYVTGAGLYYCTSPGTAGGADAVWTLAGGGGGGALWTWNGTDTSQFLVTKDDIGSGGVALSVEQRSWGPVLRVTWPTKVGGAESTWIAISDLAVPKHSGDLYRYTMTLRICGFSGTPSQWQSVGPAFLCNKQTGSSFYGLAVGGDANLATRFARAQAGVLGLASATPSWIADALTLGFGEINSLFRCRVIAKHAAASSPGFQNFVYGRKAGAAVADTLAGVNDTYFANQIAAWGAGWGSQTLDSCGIFVLGSSGTTASQYIEFDMLSVVED